MRSAKAAETAVTPNATPLATETATTTLLSRPGRGSNLIMQLSSLGVPRIWRRPGSDQPAASKSTSAYSSDKAISMPISGIRSIAAAPDTSSVTQSSPLRANTTAPAWVCCNTT